MGKELHKRINSNEWNVIEGDGPEFMWEHIPTGDWYNMNGTRVIKGNKYDK